LTRYERIREKFSSRVSRPGLLFVWLFVRILLFPSTAVAQMPPAGQVITSQSLALFEQNGVQQSVLSNEITLQVLPLFGPLLTPDGTTAAPASIGTAFSGERVTFPYRLVNTGNDDDQFELTVFYLAPSDFVPVFQEIYLDMDGDSLVDPGEPAVSTVGPLAPGESVALLLAADLPGGLTGGEVAHLDLSARSVSDTSLVDTGNVVRIVARDEASVELSKSASAGSVMPGETVTFTIDFTNTGERTASAVVLSDAIDSYGNTEGAVFVSGSASSSPPGTVEYYDEAVSQWVTVAPTADRVGGVRLLIGDLVPMAAGSLSFSLLIPDDQPAGSISNGAVVDFTGGDGRPYTLPSNEVIVAVGRISTIHLGPLGDPEAEEGGPDDRVLIPLNGADTLCTFVHELLNAGNFIDTLCITLADSTVIPPDWELDFVDESGTPLQRFSENSACVGPVPIGESRVVGLSLRATPESFRNFNGRELPFLVEARSLVDPSSANTVQDVLVKHDLPLLSITQSIREPTAQVGDILSCIVTVENITEETTVDSIIVVEHLSPGLGFAGGSDTPEDGSGASISWRIGSLDPGEKREIVFRSRVKAGQEWGRLVNNAWVYGVSELGEETSDGPARASIKIVEGVFTRRGIVMGGVFHDADGDGIWGKEETGLPGVSVFIEEGTYAVTDSAGLYSIPGVEEGTHVLRVDPTTVPDSLVPGSGGYFDLGSADGRLVVMPPSGNRVVDFPLVLNAVFDFTEDKSVGTDGAIRDRAADGEEIPTVHPRVTEHGRDPRSGTRADGSARLTDTHTADTTGIFDAITIPSTHFRRGSAYLEEIPIQRVAALSLWIREHPGWNLFIAGHTDSIPISTAEYPSNFELSLARARSVYQLLRMNGIPEGRMDYTGYGSRMPLAPNDTEAGRIRNRRVEIRAVPPDDYNEGDPGLVTLLDRPDTTAYSLADDAGVCADIVRPAEGRVFHDRSEIDVEIISPLGSQVELYVNNVPVGVERIGQKRIDISKGTFEYIFYGVGIKEGKNSILVVCKEHGGDRNTCVRQVYLAGRTHGIVPEHAEVGVPADGKTVPELVFLVNDVNGLPVRDGLFATVTGPKDLIESIDSNPHQTGVQAVTREGRIVIGLPPSRDARREKIHVSIEEISGSCRVHYTSPLRNWFLFGYGEGTLGYGSLTGTGTTYRSQQRHHDGLYAEGKIAFYGQGEIADGNLLTAAVNTRPLRNDMLFRRIEPEKYYPIFGDASELKFNAASRSGTYLRLENRHYTAMLGDFQTDLGENEFTRYQRAFNGIEGESRFGRGSVKAFITKTDQITYQEELPAEGTSGFYFLSNYPLVENSEKIRIEVRDRYHPEQIVRVYYKQTGRDYDINYMDGSILFKEPVEVTDENLNPVTIVVSYECRDSDRKNFIYGLRSAVEVTDSLSVGLTAVLEEEGIENASLVGLDLKGNLYRGLSVESEYAHSEKFLLGGGDAFRLGIGGAGKGAVKWKTYYREIDHNFFNPSFSGGKTELGSKKYGGELDWKVSRAFSIRSEGYRHNMRERDEEKSFAGVMGLYRTGLLDGKIGFAGASHRDTREGDHSSTLLLAGLSFDLEHMSGGIEWDQKLSGEEVQEYPNRVQANLSRRLNKYVTALLKHEYRTGSRTGTRHLTQLGLESNVSENLHLFSRYRLEGAMSGERGQATIGIKNKFKLSPDLTATLGSEKQATVSGSDLDDFLSFTTGALYTPSDKDYRLKADYEIRIENDRRKHLTGLAGLKRMSEQWSGLIKGDLWFCDEKYERNRIKGSSTVGLSLRPRGPGAVTLLSLIKVLYEKNSPAHPNGVDREITASFEANYPVSADWELEGKVAARWVENTFRAYTASASTYLYQAQIIRIIGGKWDVRLSGRIVDQRETETVRYGGGLELGRLVARNLWLGVGYDVGGHEDGDAPVNDFASRGFHVRLRLKFSERLLEYF
jgi:uncharacterized repeat protein (TIGR01451 family)